MDIAIARFVRGDAVSAAAASSLFRGHLLTLCTLGVALLALAALADLAWQRSGKPKRWTRAAWLAAVFALAALWPAARFAKDIAGGDWISQQSFAGAFRHGVNASLLVLIACVAAHVSWTGARRYWPLAWLIASALTAYVNGKVLVGLYPSFHVALYAGSAVMTLLAADAMVRRLSPRALERRFVALPLVIGVLAIAWSGLTMPPRDRSLALRSSAQLAQVLTWFSPRADKDVLRQAIDSEATSVARAARIELGRRPKNVVLILVDALRADAVPPLQRSAGYLQPRDTPFMEKWLKSAYRFTNAYAQASRTNRSVSATLYSREVFEPATLGLALAVRARQAGLKPLAVLPDWYMLPNAQQAGTLLEGFEWVQTYRRNYTQNRFTGLVKDALAAAGEEPFFLWLHYYGMHEPYYIGKKAHAPGTTAAQQYRAALRYLDRELTRLHGELRARGHLDDTLIVLMADHGELLGESGFEGHGIGIYEHEMHVPLAFWVPGAKSGDVHALVGNIDIVPTLFDLLRSPVDASDRGRSLAPDMQGLAAQADQSLYVVSSDGKLFGLITQRHVLRYDSAAGTFGLFTRDDAAQVDDLMGLDPELERSLIADFVQRNPAPFARQLEDPELRQALHERLATHRKTSVSKLAFLLELAVLSGDAKLFEEAGELYDGASSLERKLLILSKLYPTDRARWSSLAGALLTEHLRRPEEVVIVQALARWSVRGIDPALVTARLAQLAESCDSALAQAWLSLIHGSHTYGQSLVRFLDCAQAKDPAAATLVPSVLTSIQKLERRFDEGLEARILRLLDHGNDWVGVAAVRALGSVGGANAEEALLSVLNAGEGAPYSSERMVEASILALARIRGPELTPTLVKWGETRERVFAVVRALEQVGDERAIPYLMEKAEAKDMWTGPTARAALEVVRKRAARN